MTELEERRLRELLEVLDHPVDPDPAFVRSLRTTLAGRRGNRVGRSRRRAVIPAIAALLAIAVAVGVVAARDGERRTITGPPEPTTTTSSSTTTTPSSTITTTTRTDQASEDSRQVSIESDGARPSDGPNWLDPGPLSPRGGHQVLWTGEEMIVWGGATSDRPSHLTDGAAYDPATGRWRPLSPPPINQPMSTVALWADGRMMVISTTATLGYDPTTYTWERLGDGIGIGRPIWTGIDLAMANTDGVFRFDEAVGRWIELPAAPVQDGRTDYWSASALASVDGDLYLTQGCATELSRWIDGEWQSVPPVPEAITDESPYEFCPSGDRLAVIDGKLIVWEGADLPTVQFDPVTDSWSEIDRIPVGATEGPGGAILLDGRLLVMEAVIYEPASGTWLPVELPGAGFAHDMVWTGSELLMWGATCCFGLDDLSFTIDAWRWTPPLSNND